MSTITELAERLERIVSAGMQDGCGGAIWEIAADLRALPGLTGEVERLKK